MLENWQQKTHSYKGWVKGGLRVVFALNCSKYKELLRVDYSMFCELFCKCYKYQFHN